MFAVRLHPDAEHDLSKSVLYYDLEHSGLGQLFIQEVNATIARIQFNPYGYQRFLGGCRRAITHRFSYAVAYRIQHDETIEILAVLSTRQHPNTLMSRSSAVL